MIGSAAALNCHHEEHRLRFDRLVQLDGLFDAVIENDKILCLQAPQDLAFSVFNEGRRQHHGCLTADDGILAGRPTDQKEQQKSTCLEYLHARVLKHITLKAKKLS